MFIYFVEVVHLTTLKQLVLSFRPLKIAKH